MKGMIPETALLVMIALLCPIATLASSATSNANSSATTAAPAAPTTVDGSVQPHGGTTNALITSLSSTDASKNDTHSNLPNESSSTRVPGQTLLRVYIGENGRAIDTKVDVSSGTKALDDAAIRAVLSAGEKHWRYAPAKNGDKSDGVWQRVAVQSNTTDNPTIILLPRPDPTHKNPHPEYPIQSIKARAEGKTVIRIYVDENGDVTDAKLETSSGSKALDDGALKGVLAKGEKRWHFLPAEQDGKAVGTWQLVGIVWALARFDPSQYNNPVYKSLLEAKSAGLRGDFAAALTELQRAKTLAKTRPFEAMVSEMYAFIYAKQKDYAAAADALETSMSLVKFDATARIEQLGRICELRIAAKPDDKALTACIAATDTPQPKVKVLTLIAAVYQAQHRYVESNTAAARALVAAGNEPFATTSLLKMQFNNAVDLHDREGQRSALQQLNKLGALSDYDERMRTIDSEPATTDKH